MKGGGVINVFDLFARLALDKSGFSRGLSQAEGEARRADSNISKSLGGIGGVLENIGRKALKFTGILGTISTVVASGFGVKLAGEFEQTTVAMTTMLQNGEKAQTLLKELNSFAASTPFQFPELSSAAKSLLGFNLTAEEIIPTLSRIGDVASGLGIPLGELSVIYGKMRNQQTLYAEDLNQLSERGIPVLREFAKQFGVNESQIKKLASEGKISFANLEQAFRDLTSEGGQFYEMTLNQSKTLLGVWSTFSDNLTGLLRRIGERIIETFDLKGVLDNATSLLERWGPRVEEIVQTVLTNVKTMVSSIGNGLTSFFGTVRNVWDALTFAFTEDTKAMLQDTLGAVSGFINSAGNLALGVLDLFGTIDQAITGTRSKLEAFVYSVASVVLSVNQMIQQVIKLGTFLTDYGKIVTDQLSAIFRGDFATANALGNDATFLFNDISTFIAEIFSPEAQQLVEDGARDFASRFVSKFEEGTNSSNTKQAFETLAEGAVDSATSALKQIQTPLTTTSDLLTDVGASANTASSSVDTLGESAVKTGRSISSSLLVALAELKKFDPLSSIGQKGFTPINEAALARNALALLGLDRKTLEAAAKSFDIEAFRSAMAARAAAANQAAARHALALLGLDQKTIDEAAKNFDIEKFRADMAARAAADSASAARTALALLGLDQKTIEAAAESFDPETFRAAVAARAAADTAASIRSSLALLGLDPKTIEAAAKGFDIEEFRSAVRARAAADSASAARTALALLGLDQKTLDDIAEQVRIKNLPGSNNDFSSDLTRLNNRSAAQNKLNAALDTLAAKFTSFVNTLGASMLNLATQVVPGLGNVLQAFQAGPIAGIVAIFTELLSRSTAFSDLLEAVNNLIQPLANALNPLVEAVSQVLVALQPIIGVVAALMQAGLQPLVNIISSVVVPVLKFFAQIIAGAYNALSALVEGITFGLVKMGKIDPNGSSTGGGSNSPKPGSIAYEEQRLRLLEAEYNRTTSEAAREDYRRMIEEQKALIARMKGEFDEVEEEARPGSLAFEKKRLAELRDMLETVTTQGERDALLKQIEELEKTIAEMSGNIEDLAPEPEQQPDPIKGGLFGNGSTSVKGASSSIATAIVGVSEAALASIMTAVIAPVVNNTSALVSLIAKAATNDFAKMNKDAALLQVQAAQMQMNAASAQSVKAAKPQPNYKYLQAMGLS